MKTNLFRVKKKTEKHIVIEEERTKNPLLLFFIRHRRFILFLLLSLLICLLLISVGIAFSLFRSSSDFDISFLGDSNGEVIANNDPSIDDEDVKEELLGEVARSEGVVLLVKTFMDTNNDVIYYFSDMTSIIVMANGKIYRVSATKDGKYGIDSNGKIDSSSKKILVKSNATNLKDGTVITYYSDGTAMMLYNGVTTFIRNSNNIKLNAGVSFYNVLPSGVAGSGDKVLDGNITMTTFSDNTKLVDMNGKKYIVNPNAKAGSENGKISYDKNNSFSVFEEKKLKDGNVVTYFDNGSAVITLENGKTIFVKKSGDIVIKNEKIFEIVTNRIGYSKVDVKCSDSKVVTYFDNGGAVILYPDGTKKYVVDNNDILYDGNKNIISSPPVHNQIADRVTTDGYRVISFDNGKSQVIKKDGSSIIIDTDKLIFDESGNITSQEEKPGKDKDKENETNDKNDDKNNDKNEEEVDPLEGMYVSEAENRYNDTKSIEYTNFIIRNTNNRVKKFRIVIEEVENYSKYKVARLSPSFVKFQATIGDDFVSATNLAKNTWMDENNKVNYVIYDGSIGAKATLEVALTLYVDYEFLTNSDQNKAFIGTIKVYVNE